MRKKSTSLLLASVLLLMTGCSSKVQLDQKKDVFKVEYGEKIPTEAKSYFKNKKDLLKKVKLSTKIKNQKGKEYASVGKYTLTFIYDGDKEQKFDVKVEVQDTTKPTFKDLKKEIKVEQNAKDVDFTKYFKVEDLSKVTVKVDDKKVDLSKTGEYTLTVTATDEYKNKTEEEIKVIVVSLEEAEKGNVSAMLDGTKPQSEALAQKQETNNTGNNTATGNTGNAGSTGNINTGGNTSTGGGGIQQPQKPAQPFYRTDIASQYVSQINAWRQANGVPALQVTAAAQAEANMRAMQLVSNYGHNDSYGFIENIGNGSVGSDFFTLWKNSPGHNGTMLRHDVNPDGTTGYKGFAVAVVEYNGWWYAVTSFDLWY